MNMTFMPGAANTSGRRGGEKPGEQVEDRRRERPQHPHERPQATPSGSCSRSSTEEKRAVERDHARLRGRPRRGWERRPPMMATATVRSAIGCAQARA